MFLRIIWFRPLQQIIVFFFILLKDSIREDGFTLSDSRKALVKLGNCHHLKGVPKGFSLDGLWWKQIQIRILKDGIYHIVFALVIFHGKKNLISDGSRTLVFASTLFTFTVLIFLLVWWGHLCKAAYLRRMMIITESLWSCMMNVCDHVWSRSLLLWST